ncbi:MAG: oligosaccharide flippase family protein, partial [Pseudomonadota bacterium]
MTTLATPPRRSFLSDVFSVARTRAAVLVMNVASGVLVARLLGAEGKGLVAALTVAPAMILILCELGVVHSAAFHIGKKSASLDRVFGSLLMIGVVTTLFGVAICALYFKATWLPAYNWALVGLAIGTIPAAVFRSYASGVFLGTERIQLFNRASWIPPLTRLVLILALTGALGFGAYGAIGAQLAAGVAMALYAASLLRGLSSARPRFEWETTRAIASLGVSFAISLFLMTMLYKINIVLLQRMNTLEELGVYTVGANLAQYIWQIPAAMTAVVLSRGANAADADAYTKKVLVLFRLTIIVGVLGAGAIALAGPILIPLVYGESFAPSAQVLAAMLPGVTAF